MKKILALASCFLLAVCVFAGCQGKEPPMYKVEFNNGSSQREDLGDVEPLIIGEVKELTENTITVQSSLAIKDKNGNVDYIVKTFSFDEKIKNGLGDISVGSSVQVTYDKDTNVASSIKLMEDKK